MKKIFRKEVIIGLIVALSIVVLVVGIDFLKGVNVFKAANYYYVTYTNVEGLAVSAPVSVNGYKVGLVRDISYEYDNPGHVRVELSLDKSLRVPKGTKAVLGTDLLGTASIKLDMAPGGDFHNVGDVLVGENASGLMDNVSGEVLPSVSKVMTKVDTLLTNVNVLVSDPAIAASVKRLDAITANLEATSRQLNAVVKTLPPIAKNVNAITENVSVMSGNLSGFSSTLNGLPVDSLVDNLNCMSANLRQLSLQLNDRNSTLGQLMNDRELYDNINSAVSSLDSLLIDVKKNPKRYISIKLL